MKDKTLLKVLLVVVGASSVFLLYKYTIYSKKKKELPAGTVPSETFRQYIGLPPAPTARARLMRSVISRWGNKIRTYAKKQGVEPHLVAALICQESSGNPNASRSEEPPWYTRLKNKAKYPDYASRPDAEIRLLAHSMGLMQVLGVTFLETKYGVTTAYKTTLKKSDILNPDNNLDIGTKYLAGRIKRCGKWDGVRAYNTGTCFPKGSALKAGNKYRANVKAYYNSYSPTVWGGQVRSAIKKNFIVIIKKS